MKTFLQYITELNHLSDLLKKENGNTFLVDLLSKHVVVSVKVDSSAFVVMNDSGTLRFYGRNGAQEIDLVKRSTMNIYEAAIAHIRSMPWKRLPSGVKFFFEMFDDNLNPIIKYASKPKNNLILLFAKKGSSLLRVDDPLLTSVANLLQVSPPPILFNGELNAKQISEILQFASMPTEQRIKQFGQQNFVKFILSVFLPKPEVAWLIENGMEGVVFFFGKDREPTPFKVVDPGFTDKILNKMGDFSGFYKAFGEALYPLVIAETQKFLKSSQKPQKPRNPQQAFINIAVKITNDILNSKGHYLITTLEPFREMVTSRRFASVSHSLLGSSLLKEFWFGEDVYRFVVNALARPKLKTDAKTGLTATYKATLNDLHAQLHQLGLIT